MWQVRGDHIAHCFFSMKTTTKMCELRHITLMRCYQCDILHFTMSSTRSHVNSTLTFSPWGVCTTTGAPGPASPTLGPAHTHTLTVAHTVALTPYLSEIICRYAQGDVAKAPNRCTTRRSARKRDLRRQSRNRLRRRGLQSSI